jgi:hypothetical protein
VKIRIKTDIPLSREAQSALSDFAYGSAWFDLDGGFKRSGDTVRRQSVELLVTDHLPDGVVAEQTRIRHVGSETIPEGIFLLLRDDQGLLHDVSLCEQFIGTRHVMGALFRDETGTVWAARKLDGEAGSGEIAADWPLEQVSAHTHPTVAAGFGQIIDSLPAMGEFQLTNEIPARVAWIPWWSGFGSNPKDGISNPVEDAVLQDLVEQARAIHETGTVHPDPAPAPDEPGSLDLRITLRADQLLIDTPDGRQLMIELEGDQLKAHAYNALSDAPASLRVVRDAPIEADASDHLSELYKEDPSP